MHKEAGEKRDFLPEFIEALGQYNIEVVIENGYGHAMDTDPSSYLKANSKARFGTISEAYQQDLVIVLRFPSSKELDLMKCGSILMSMIHFETRPDRVKSLQERNITGLSLDAIMDDNGQRLVENIAGTSWNGMKAAFQELSKNEQWFFDTQRLYTTVTIIGFGSVGIHAARAASKYGSLEFHRTAKIQRIPGVLVQSVGRNITQDEKALANILKTTDILADASKRDNPTISIIKNEFLELLPHTTVILDLTADPYNFDTRPYQVKGIEGIPTGSLDGYVFQTDHPVYSVLSKYVNTKHRRVVVSCNAWPAITPARCMNIYGKQISCFFPILFSKPLSQLNKQSDNILERALARSTLEYFLSSATFFLPNNSF
jgi:alanine dehydrogenase